MGQVFKKLKTKLKAEKPTNKQEETAFGNIHGFYTSGSQRHFLQLSKTYIIYLKLCSFVQLLWINVLKMLTFIKKKIVNC